MTTILAENQEVEVTSEKNHTQEAFNTLLDELVDIETLVLTDRFKPSKAIEALLKLSNFTHRKPNDRILSSHSGNTQMFCTRVAQLYCRLFFDMSWSPDRQDLIRLMLQKRFIGYCFELSGFWSNQFLIDHLKQRADAVRQSGKDLPNNQAAIRLIALGSMANLSPEVLVELTVKTSEIASILTIGLLLDVLPITFTGESNRRFLLENFESFDALSHIPAYANAVANVWMLCSYSTSPKKHLIKQRLNQWYRNYHAALHLKIPTPGSIKEPKNTFNKPVLVIAAERFTSHHAVFRWYAKIVQKFKKDFFLVLVCMEGDSDDHSRSLFDRCILINQDNLNPQEIVDQCAPDLVYYPSIGMRTWAISLANIRWGKLQLMSLGHPASSFSDCIDVLFTGSAMFGGTEVCSENQLILSSKIGSTLTKLPDIEIPTATTLSNDIINIAIPCNAMKINLQFLVALKEIEQQAQTPIHFTFFPNVAGLAYLSTLRRIQSFFPKATIVYSKSYQNYLNQLSEYHFAISPFPFGNATSTIDCLMVGLPVLAMIGPEPHSRTDFITLEAFDLQDYCVADSPESYIQGAIHWINNPDMLTQLRDLIASKQVGQQHFDVLEEEALSNEYLSAINWAWANQEQLINQRQQAYEAAGNWAN